MLPTFKSILMPTDWSPASARAAEYAAALAARFGASLHLLHVVAYPMDGAAWPDAYWVELSDLRERMRADAERQLAALAKSLPGVNATAEVRDGNPPRTIVAVAKDRGCDLIVMGTHGHGAVAHLLLGSVAERVVRTAPCPVLTVGPASAAAEEPALAAAVGAAV
jgi:nucleotide-binding universal stress UspA family protein